MAAVRAALGNDRAFLSTVLLVHVPRCQTNQREPQPHSSASNQHGYFFFVIIITCNVQNECKDNGINFFYKLMGRLLRI